MIGCLDHARNMRDADWFSGEIKAVGNGTNTIVVIGVSPKERYKVIGPQDIRFHHEISQALCFCFLYYMAKTGVVVPVMKYRVFPPANFELTPLLP